MSLWFGKPVPLLPGLTIERTGPKATPTFVSERESGTYVNIYLPTSGFTLAQRISMSRGLELAQPPTLDEALVVGTSETLMLVGLIFCIPVFTAVIGLPLLLLGRAWPKIVRGAGLVRAT